MIDLKKCVLLIGSTLLVFLQTGCGITPKILEPQDIGPRKLAVFFDGTANDETSDTNIRKLHSLAALQQRPNISTFYVEGVGANGKTGGMATGWGIGHRVRLAYQYLAKNYRDGDEIYLFGFSRGAFSSRILASMLHHGGLPGQALPAGQINDHFADIVYTAFKGDKLPAQRQSDLQQAIINNKLPVLKPVEVTFMGLWDTVEALGLPDLEENIDIPNPLYGDQLCNVRKAAHAMAADDDRARIFTPILLTRAHLVKSCSTGPDSSPSDVWISATLNNKVDEVWFAGAHADVGGGYVNGLLSGVSLNWMIGKLSSSGLLPPGAAVPENKLEMAHDPENDRPFLYHQLSRHLSSYAATSPYNDKNLKVHRSVIDRLKQQKPAPNEFQWFAKTEFFECFRETATGYEYLSPPKEACKLQITE